MEDIKEIIQKEETRQKLATLPDEDRRWLSTNIDGFMRGDVEGHRRGIHLLRNLEDIDRAFNVYLDIGFTNCFTEIAHSYLAVKPERKDGQPESLKIYCKDYDVETGERVCEGSSKAVRFIRAHKKYGTGGFDEWFISFLEPELKKELREALRPKEQIKTSIKDVINDRLIAEYERLTDDEKSRLEEIYERKPEFLQGSYDHRSLSRAEIKSENVYKVYQKIGLSNLIPKVTEAYLKHKPTTQMGKVTLKSWFSNYDVITGKRHKDPYSDRPPQGSRVFRIYKRSNEKKKGIGFDDWIRSYLPKEIEEKLMSHYGKD